LSTPCTGHRFGDRRLFDAEMEHEAFRRRAKEPMTYRSKVLKTNLCARLFEPWRIDFVLSMKEEQVAFI
jgi:hypothetical protein